MKFAWGLPRLNNEPDVLLHDESFEVDSTRAALVDAVVKIAINDKILS